MNKSIQLFVLAFLLFFFNGAAQSISKYGVELIDNPKVYKTQVKQNSAFKLVDLKTIEGLYFDIKYATKDNFTGEKIYETPEAFARTQVAKAIERANKKFNEHGLAIKIFDAYRPYTATVIFYEVYKDTTFVASPYKGSRHNRGCAIDITLVDAETGEEIPMPTPYDDFTEKASPTYTKLPKSVINNRTLLIETMMEFGFTVYPSEWWHFDFMGWENYPIMDIEFKDLKD